MRDLIATTARRYERSLMQMTYHIISLVNKTFLSRPRPRLGMDAINMDESIIISKLSKLNVNKSAGPDDIYPRILFEEPN